MRRERPGEFEALERAERQPGRRTEGELVQVERTQDLEGVGGQRPLLACRTDASHRADEADLAQMVRPGHRVLEQAHRREQRKVLERARDAETGDPVRADRQEVLPIEAQTATGGVVDAADDVEHRRLAGAVRADQPEDLAIFDLEREPVERDDPAERHRDLIDFEQCHQFILPLGRQLTARAAATVAALRRASQTANRPRSSTCSCVRTR